MGAAHSNISLKHEWIVCAADTENRTNQIKTHRERELHLQDKKNTIILSSIWF